MVLAESEDHTPRPVATDRFNAGRAGRRSCHADRVGRGAVAPHQVAFDCDPTKRQPLLQHDEAWMYVEVSALEP